jgi:hypothetical protein
MTGKRKILLMLLLTAAISARGAACGRGGGGGLPRPRAGDPRRGGPLRAAHAGGVRAHPALG